MSEKFIKRLKKRIVISTLTMFVILSQTVPTIVNAASNDDIMDVINGGGTETSIVIEEDAIEAPAANPVVKERSEDTSDNNWTSNYSYSNQRKEWSDGDEGYNSDGREHTSRSDGNVYKTAKYWAEQHPELKEDLDNYFGEKNLFNMGDINYKGQRTCLWDAITYKDQVYKALKNKTQRSDLAKIAVENGIIEKESYKAAPYVALFEYYGIINRADGLLDYDNSTKAYLSREQAALMLGRFMHSDSYIGFDGDYGDYVEYYDSSMLLGDDEKAVTSKELKSSMTRLEFIYLLVDSYFPSDVQEARADGSSKDAAKLFEDIDKDDYITTEWVKGKGLYGKGPNEAARAMFKYNKIDDDTDAHVQAAYKLGILTKDSKGNSNLFDNVTYSQAVRMLINAGIACADDKSASY